MADWFGTTYYHILYKHRSHEEAKKFIHKLDAFLKLPQKAKVLDLGCGRGRHSIFINTLGYEVLGTDLSPANINLAKQSEKETLKFAVGDMREPTTFKFDVIFNLFTSFGYFTDDNENLKILNSIKKQLNPNGIGVIDFMNTHYVMANLVPEEVKTIDNIIFHIKRYEKNGMVCKDIIVEDGNKKHHFSEQVRLVSLELFQSFLKKIGLTVTHTMGNYNLDPYNKYTSERLILIFK